MIFTLCHHFKKAVFKIPEWKTRLFIHFSTRREENNPKTSLNYRKISLSWLKIKKKNSTNVYFGPPDFPFSNLSPLGRKWEGVKADLRTQGEQYKILLCMIFIRQKLRIKFIKFWKSFSVQIVYWGSPWVSPAGAQIGKMAIQEG